MPIRVINGNIFTTNCHCIVNTVNCVGVMGAGIALECRLRYVGLYERYLELCNSHEINIGKLWLFRGADKWVLNFPTKTNWKLPTKREYIEKGLVEFVATYERNGLRSVAFPLLGAQNGGVDPSVSLQVMVSYLEGLPIEIEIYRYDPYAPDDLYLKMKKKIESMGIDGIAKFVGLRANYAEKVFHAFTRDDICQINQLSKIKGLGIKTIEKVFNFAVNESPISQMELKL